MSITVVTTLHCEHEGCKDYVPSPEGAKSAIREIRKTAKVLGWARVGGKDFCEKHKPVWKKVLVPAV